jgi:hypothetical protein
MISVSQDLICLGLSIFFAISANGIANRTTWKPVGNFAQPNSMEAIAARRDWKLPAITE